MIMGTRAYSGEDEAAALPKAGLEVYSKLVV
jgi:hypothetical protein